MKEVDESRKREYLASGATLLFKKLSEKNELLIPIGHRSGQEDQKRKKGKHNVNSLETIFEKDRPIVVGKVSQMENKNCLISASGHLESTRENDFDTSLRATGIDMIVRREDDISKHADADRKKMHDVASPTSLSVVKNNSSQAVQTHFSADSSCFLHIVDMDLVRKNGSEQSLNNNPNPPVDNKVGLRESVDVDNVMQSDASPEIDSISNDVTSTNSEQCKIYSKRVKNKSFGTDSLACLSFPVAQDCTSADSPSLVGTAEMGFLREIGDGTSLGDNLMPSIEKENSGLMGGSCAQYDNLNGHEEAENKGKKVIDFSDRNLEIDRNDPSTVSQSFSAVVELDAVGKETVDASIENNLRLNTDTEDCGKKKNSDDTSPIESSLSFEMEAMPVSPERALTSHTRKKLLVLDLNGLLADIFLDVRNAHKAHTKIGGKSVFKRPYCDDFLKFCFERFDIGIWSSRKKYNVDAIVNFLMGDSKHKLLFCWDQAKCTLTGFRTLENMHKPLVLKELKKLWDKEETDLPWEKGEYSPSNTLLVDDSPYKALSNPPHTAIFPQPYRFNDENDTSLGPEGDLRAYLEGLAEASDVQIYVKGKPFGQHAITVDDPSWNFYLQVIDNVGKSSSSTQGQSTLSL